MDSYSLPGEVTPVGVYLGDIRRAAEMAIEEPRLADMLMRHIIDCCDEVLAIVEGERWRESGR